MWPLLVEVADVDAEDMLELAATEDQEAIEALPTYAADPAFRVGIRVRRADWCADDRDVFALEDAVEGAAELRVSIVDQEARPLAAVAEVRTGSGVVRQNTFALPVAGKPLMPSVLIASDERGNEVYRQAF